MNKTKPILFSTPMVIAILDGRKTQTRRVMKPQPDNKDCFRISPHNNDYNRFTMWAKDNWAIIENGEVPHWKCPYGKPGDILWVRETWSRDESGEYVYRANYGTTEDDSFPPSMFKWKPSIHMPREAARIFLRVTNVRVERLRDITPGDIYKEGVWQNETYIFAELWNSTIKKQDLDKYDWHANPWVWVYEFERVSEDGSSKGK